MKGWKITRAGDILNLSKGNITLVFGYGKGKVLLFENLAWERLYLPKFSLKGKTVLDIGAGAGETAWFYFEHGAAKVIAIEPDRRLFELLRENANRNHWDVELLNIPFVVECLGKKHDFMKMDCEGCESQLLEASSIKPCVIEVHSDLLASRLQERFGLRLAGVGMGGSSIWVGT